MNTVDALNVLGKALCGDSFEVKPGLTDAETILEIAKNYTGGSGSGGGDRIEIMVHGDGESIDPLPTGLTVSDFKDVIILVDIDDTVAMCWYPSLIEYGNYMHVFIYSDYWSADSGQAGAMQSMVLEYNPETGEVSQYN